MKATVNTKAESIRMLVALIKKGKDAYYAGKVAKIARDEIPRSFAQRIQPGFMTDAVYDTVEDCLAEIDPSNKILSQVGSGVATNKKLRVKLPYPMASLRKGKPDGSMQKWLDAHPGPYNASFKLDGVSILARYRKNQPVQLYTRGKNNVGGDISFMASQFRIPQKLPYDLVVRGEALIPLAKFKQMYERKVGVEDKTKFSNPRNMVAGITNRNDHHEALKHIDIVMYDMYSPRMAPSKALAKLKSLGFHVVTNKTLANLSVPQLQSMLVTARRNSKYELDGLVVAQDKRSELATDYPDYAIAFKDEGQQQTADVKVVSVTWQMGRHRFSPVINIEPVKLSGVIIKNVSGGSAEYINENNIGPGAVITIIRSGDVIPKVIGVVRKAKHPQMPAVPFVWKGAHVYPAPAKKTANQPRSTEQKVRTIEHFFSSLGVERFKGATIARFVDAGYDTVRKIVAMPGRIFVTLGTSPKVMQEVMDQMDAKIDNVPLPNLMAASGIFGEGFGVRLATELVRNIPNIMDLADHPDLSAKIATVEGFGATRAKQVAAKIKRFADWIYNTPQITWVVPKPKRVVRGGKLVGQAVGFTGVRSKELEAAIEAAGGKVTNGVTRETTILIAKDPAENSLKIQAARSKGLPILTPSQFEAKYLK